MRATAAVLYEVKKPLVIEEVELLDPGPHEVQVRWVANGVCHSDYHLMSGDVPHPLPVVLGHEAAGVVERIGPGVESVAVGDHVCSSYIPSCGKCGYCIGGQPTMCALRDKPRWFMLDGTPRLRKNGQGLHHFLQVAGYATHAVLPEVSVIPIRKDAPLDVACLVSSGMFLQQRVLTGSSFGGGRQRTDVPMLIDLYMDGKYRLDEMITRRVPLEELNNAFDLMLAGEVKRSVVVYA